MTNVEKSYEENVDFYVNGKIEDDGETSNYDTAFKKFKEDYSLTSD